MSQRMSSQNLDKMDKLVHFKSRFYNSNNEIYMDGNSLGKLPIQTKNQISSLVENQWGKNLIRS